MGLLGISPMNAGSPRLRRKEMLVMTLTIKRNIMIFSDLKKKPLFQKEKDWAAAGEDSDEEEFINLALMATSEEQEASSTGSQVFTSNLSDLFKEECKSAIDEISNELYNLHISLKSLTRENARIKSTNDLLLERNTLLRK